MTNSNLSLINTKISTSINKISLHKVLNTHLLFINMTLMKDS